MRIMIYLTSNGAAQPGAPALYLEEGSQKPLPQHPDGHDWTYFATVSVNDPMLGREQVELRDAIARGEPHIGASMPLGL